jgi:kumamolisin
MSARNLIKTLLSGTVGAATMALLGAGGAQAQLFVPNAPRLVILPTSITHPADAGVRAHTNIIAITPSGGPTGNVNPAVAPPYSGYLFETPLSLQCIYGLTTATAGCNPNKVTAHATGGSHAIAIVDAYAYSTAASDLAAFDKQFGIPAPPSFTIIYGTGSPSAGCKSGPKPASSASWNLEEALDIEYSHAMAPSAKIYLVEAASSSLSALLNAEQVAAKCVEANTEGEVSNSWGSSEFSSETSDDTDFTGTDVVFYASTGDDTFVSWPATSPNVVAVGGTGLARNQINGDFAGAQSWNDLDGIAAFDAMIGGGAGPSQFEPAQTFQNSVRSIIGNVRAIADIGADAAVGSGVWVYNTNACPSFGPVGGVPWCELGGTSVASPTEAGISNNLGLFAASSAAWLGELYNNTSSFRTDHINSVLSGNCGASGHVLDELGISTTYPGGEGQSYDPEVEFAATGIPWGFCTGWGSLVK